MIYLSGLVACLLVLTTEAKVGNSSQGSFCSETNQCLLFNLECQTNKYEVRHYESVKLVSTNVTSRLMEVAMIPLFKRLYNYITGENKDDKNIEMTAPVLIKIPEKGFYEKGVFTMSFILPAEHQMNPPEPTCKDVYIEEMKEMRVYVESYGGWISTLSDCWHSYTLSSAVNSVNAKYNTEFHYSVGYNSLMSLTNRHNEVWFVVEGDPVCSSSE
ncbi:heme-binding protein 2 [Kryptolebias marmoratus]|uniref:Heme-binding protein 1 n=1 Tax=Kryptolebias marmoratus TaxID=37003 RepID=A0A3Q3AY25_KRYMA|nr:heme-binding protein 2 [Kryptolebias marmoratus]